MKIVPYKSFWLGLSSLLVLASVVVFGVYGLRLSADFTEGTLIALEFSDTSASEVMEESTPEGEAMEGTMEKTMNVTQAQMRDVLNTYQPAEGLEELGSLDVKLSADGTFIMKFRQLQEAEEEAIFALIREQIGDFELLQLRDVSPVYAQTFRDRALLAILAASVMIILYITFAFRRVSRGIKSWKLGVAAIVALIHDIVIIVGIFVLLGQFYQVEIDALFITALLSVMGFSVNDTIVVFDRVRENLLTKHHAESFDDTAERSLQQTLARSINTSVSTLLVLVSILLFGFVGELFDPIFRFYDPVFNFVFALALGVIVGTYSSIFLATPLLTLMQNKSSK